MKSVTAEIYIYYSEYSYFFMSENVIGKVYLAKHRFDPIIHSEFFLRIILNR